MSQNKIKKYFIILERKRNTKRLILEQRISIMNATSSDKLLKKLLEVLYYVF